MQKLKPWQYQGINEDVNLQPLPSPERFLQICEVTSDNPQSVIAMESLLLGALVMGSHSKQKNALLSQTLKLIQTGTF